MMRSFLVQPRDTPRSRGIQNQSVLVLMLCDVLYDSQLNVTLLLFESPGRS